jgi:uncharacterized protein YfaS (alpha-2-macroglobulin family)
MKAVFRLALFGVLACCFAPLGARAQTAPPFFGDGAVFTPGTPVTVTLHASDTGDVDFTVRRLSFDSMVELERAGAGDVLAALTKGRPVKSLRAHVSTDPKAAVVNLGTFEPGHYALSVNAYGKPFGTSLFSVTTLGVATVSTASELVAYAVDLRTMRARSDVTFQRYDDHAPAETRRTDASGMVRFPLRPGDDADHGEFFTARGSDGAAVLTAPVRGFTAPTAEQYGYVQTDRPIYRPGQIVHYRAVLRDGAPGGFTVPSGLRTIRIRDARDKELANLKRPVDAFGVISGDVTLADDAPLGQYRVDGGDDGAFSGSFSVEAYKKPEYVVDVAAPRTTVGGDTLRIGVAARYLFGRPVAGAHLHYHATFTSAYTAWWRLPFSFSGYVPPPVEPPDDVEGDAVTDGAGRAAIAIATKSASSEQLVELDVDARDDAGRTVTVRSTAQLTPASFKLAIASAKYFNRAGDPVDVTVRSIAYGSNAPRPGTPVAIAFTREWWDGGAMQRELDTAAPRDAVTDAHGAATVRWRPSRAGYYDITAAARDERGRETTATTTVWITAERYENPYAFTQTSVVPQQPSYRPGERATLLVVSPRADTDALVRITGAAAESAYVVHLTGTTTTIAVDPPAGVARYTVSVGVPSQYGLSTGSAAVVISPAPHVLRVAVKPDKAKYAPGERARFALHVEGPDGKPASAEVGLAVVDDAIFALREDRTIDPWAAFYAGSGPYRPQTASWSNLNGTLVTWIYRPLQRIGSATSRSAAGATADVFSVNAPLTVAAAAPIPPRPSFDALRTDFRDTAFWSPSVVTGNDGNAIVSFDWPDSLTSFTATGVAVTRQTDLGRGAGSALVTKDFLVRLATPRFLRSGDAARFTAIAQGTPRAKTALLRFSAPDLGVADATVPARFDRRATTSVTWNVRAHELGTASLRLAGTSETLRDGLQTSLPVETNGTALHDRGAGTLPASSSLALRLPRGSDAGDLRIDLAPSAVAQLAAGVRLLEVYPYYCVEQTMSAALPAVYVDRMRKRMRIAELASGPSPEAVGRKAVQRLVQLQHADGSWGWWERDPANPFMTAYALYGLTELQRDGIVVPQTTLDFGARSLASQLAQPDGTLSVWSGGEQSAGWNTRAFMLFALAGAKPASVDRALLAKADAQAPVLNSYALATLGLAHVELGDRAGAQPLLDELLRRVTDDGTYAQWKGPGWHYHWEDDPIETTAYALRFLNAMAPNDPHVAHAVNWLRAQQRGSWFATTKDTAAAIYAISEALPPAPGELDPHETITISLGGKVVKRVRVDRPVLAAADASVVVPAKLMRHGGTLRFTREGTGGLSWTTDWTRYAAAPPAEQLDPAFSVTRTYSAQDGNDWRVGDQVDVEVTVTAREEAQYVAIEDPLPAGLEYQPRQHESGDEWNGLQFLDDRVVFFATRLAPNVPIRLRYTLRATTAGTFSAPAPVVYGMYGPPRSAVGRTAHVAIR